MTVAEMLGRMSSREFHEWIEFDGIAPIGESRADLRHGIACASAANLWAGKGRKAKPVDFIPWLKSERKPQTTEQMKNILRAIAAAAQAK